MPWQESVERLGLIGVSYVLTPYLVPLGYVGGVVHPRGVLLSCIAGPIYGSSRPFDSFAGMAIGQHSSE